MTTLGIILIIIGLGTLTSLGAAAPDPATIYVDPETIADTTFTPGSTFSINVTVSEVTDLWGYTVRVSYDAAILTATSFTSYEPFTDASPSKIDDSGVFTLGPKRDGAYRNWTGTYTYWDEVNPDGDATYISTAASNLTQSSTLYTPYTSSWDAITKVKVTIVARQTTGDEKVMPILVIGEEVYKGSAATPTTIYESYSSEWTTNPKTGSAWTFDEVNALEAGAKSLQEGATWDGEIRVTQLYVDVYHTAGWVSVTYSLPLGVTQGVSGTLPLVRIDFSVDDLGVSELDLHHTALSTPYATPIAHVTIDGYFSNSDLLAKYNHLLADYVALNTTYHSLLIEHNYLLGRYDQLNSSYSSLLANYTRLQTDYNTLQADYNSLWTTYGSLNSTYNSLKADIDDLRSKYEGSTNELSTAGNLNYLLAVTTMIFIATTIYFVLRKPKIRA